MKNFRTTAVQAAVQPDPLTGAIVTPLYQSSTYVLDAVGRDRGYDYTRSSNPTRRALETCLAELEDGRHCIAYASGMAAVDSCLRLLSSGDHIVCSDDVYGGVSRLLNTLYPQLGITVSYVDTSNPALVEASIRPETALIWVETPTNPLLKVCSIQDLSEIARRHSILLGVDSTFCSPALLQPLTLGADLVLHSTTKYLSGHNQIIGGAVITSSDKLAQKLRYIQKSIGAVPSPFDCWLTLLGIKTLALRMKAHCENAQIVAQRLASQPLVRRVYYPGLDSHETHALACREMKDFGGMLSFELHGSIETGIEFINSLKLCRLAESLGSVETLVTHPASMTHAEVPRVDRHARGLADGLIRLSVGIEAVDDIIADLEQALRQIDKKSMQRNSGAQQNDR